MSRACYLHGRGLVSTLGPELDTAVVAAAAGGRPPGRLQLTADSSHPYFAIGDGGSDWYTRAASLVRSAVAQCGQEVDREAPLYLASSSLNVGALENGAPFLADCHAFSALVANWLDWRGPVLWLSTACTSSLNALSSAQRRIQTGRADAALILGVELANRYSAAGFGALQLLDPQAPRPLAAERAGLVLGEAVAALHLSRRPGRWRIAGGANLIDGSNPAGAAPSTLHRVLRRALDEAGLSPADIDLIKLQAAGSPHNDAVEVAALAEIFTPLPPLLTLKTLLGHTLGASGAAEIALLTRCLESGQWPAPPAIRPDPALCPTQPLVLADRAPARVRFLLANVLGFGGGHACALLEDLHA